MTAGARLHSDGIVLLYHSVHPEPAVVRESVKALRACSGFDVFPVNAALGYPAGLDRIRFAAIVLHYTMFYGAFEPISQALRAYLTASAESFKVVFFQDEQMYLSEKADFCSRYGVDLIYTCIDDTDAPRAYARSGDASVVTYLPGYVGAQLAARKSPSAERPIDIGYRGRKPPPSWTGAALEKYEIAERFLERSADLGLTLDIATSESSRIYGEGWLRFIESCKGMLGTESGADIADPHGGASIPYRTISPRHFEAAAARSCQILYEGHYSGVMEPDVHYIPLRKDFSNFNDVIEAFRDPKLRRRLTERAHSDLVASGRYSYESFVAGFDRKLHESGLRPGRNPTAREQVASALYPSKLRRRATRYQQALRAGTRVTINRLRGRAPTDALRGRRSRHDPP